MKIERYNIDSTGKLKMQGALLNSVVSDHNLTDEDVEMYVDAIVMI